MNINNIKESIISRRLGKLRADAITEGANGIIKNLSIIEESNVLNSDGSTTNPILSSRLYSHKKKKIHEFEKYITERRLRYRTQYNNTVLVSSRYSYEKVDTFFNSESYFSRSVSRQVETTLRNGFRFVSDNSEMSAEVRKELTMLQVTSRRLLHQIISRMIGDILKYGITIIEKVRKRIPDNSEDDVSSRLANLRSIPPHKTYFHVDKDGVIRAVQNHNLTLRNRLSLRRGILDNIGLIPIKSIALGVMTDAGDDIYPPPPCFQMLNDILSLRSLEETIEMIGFQFGSPLLHSKVGSDDNPAQPGEVNDVHNDIVSMAANGMITTDNRVEITAVNLQSAVPDLMPFIAHFKNRVLVGSGSSSVSVGELDTSNRATSESMDNAMGDHCTYVADIVCNLFTYDIIPDILINSYGYKPDEIIDESGEMIVKLEFNEMSIEKLISKVNNITNLYQSNLLTLPEARRRLKEVPLVKSNEKDLYLNKVQIPLANAKKAKSTAPDSKIASLNQPSNQYGKKSGPGSSKDSIQ